jgi:hypothetical protein
MIATGHERLYASLTAIGRASHSSECVLATQSGSPNAETDSRKEVIGWCRCMSDNAAEIHLS